jgi:hypothetical protein
MAYKTYQKCQLGPMEEGIDRVGAAKFGNDLDGEFTI